jgi:predicted nuclease of predicted toxin-antitoxin system
MRFLADMCISPKTVGFLRDLGHEVVHLYEEGLDQLPDPAILDKARQEGRVLLTSDLDFGELVAASGANLPSVVVFRLRDMRPGGVNQYLREVVAHHADALDEGAVISVDEGHVRVRPLPIRGAR